MKIAYVYPGDGSDVRSLKSLETFKRLDEEVIFIGWLRSSEVEPHKISGVRYFYHSSNTGFGGINIIRGLPGFWLFINRTIRKQRPDVVIVANEENGLFEAIFRRKDTIYICDIHDSIADRIRKGMIAHILASRVKMVVYNRFDKLIFTDDIRKKRAKGYCGKSHVIYNAPFFEDVHVRDKQHPRSIYLSGTLNLDRGISQLIEAIDNIRHKGYDINILVAGHTNDTRIERIIQENESIKYVGVVPHKESINLMANSLAVLAYYAPEIQNNVYASPNKVYECMLTQTPVLINSECLIARYVEDTKTGLSAPYYDVDKLQNNIMRVYSSDFVPDDNRDLLKKRFAWDNAIYVYENILKS